MPFNITQSASTKYRPVVRADKIASKKLGKQKLSHDGEVFYTYSPKGLPIDPEYAPRFAEVLSSHKLHDIFNTSWRWCVTEPLVEKVNELEPGVHQFFPAELRLKSGEKIIGKYWFMNICHRTDAIDPDKTIMSCHDGHYSVLGGGFGDKVKLVFRKNDIKGMCMWIDKRFNRSFFFSDELLYFVKESKMKDVSAWEVFAE